MSKQKVWIFNHYATNMYFNEGGRHYWFSKNLLEKDYQPTIFCANTLHNNSDSVTVKKGKYITKTIDNIPFVFVKTKSSIGNGFDRIKNMFFFYRNLKKTAKQYIRSGNKPDIILASSVHPLTLVAGIKIGKKYNIPVICEVRDLWPEAIFAFNKAKENSLIGKLLIKGEHWIYKNASALIFTKEGDTDYIKERKWDIDSGGDVDLSKCHYINNGLDLNDFINSIDINKFPDKDLESNKFKVIYAGAIRPVNNVDKLIESARLLKDNSDIKFLIYGDGNQKESVENLIKKYNLTNVLIKGHIDKKYIPYILSKSSVNILNYSQTRYNWNRGNSSNKLFEYMASSKPIISTVKMGYSPFSKYNIGYEIEDASPKDISEAVLKVRNLTKEEYKKLSNNAYEASKNYDFQVHTNNLIKIIKSIT